MIDAYLQRWGLEPDGDAVVTPSSRLFLDVARTAEKLLATPHDVVVLHGDVHHGNVLDFGARGWLAIDPKGLLGERAFDLANVFCDPTLAWSNRPGRLARQSHVVAEAAVLDRHRLLRWILAYADLSAAWLLGSGSCPNGVLTIAALARSELRKP